MHFSNTLWVFMAGLCLHFCHEAVAQALPPSYQTKIDSVLQAHNVPGAAVILADSSGEVSLAHFGMADRAAGLQVTDSTLFCVGSVAKTFLAAGIMIAEENGLLSLEDPLMEALPDGLPVNRYGLINPVRLIHLLEHTAGIDEAHFHLSARAGSSTPLATVMQLSKSSLQVRWRPGDFAEYNTLGYVAAAHMLQAKTGLLLGGFMQESLFTPLEMSSATYQPAKESVYKLAKSYESDGLTEIDFPDLPQWPAGALSLTTGDMGKYLLMLMQEGKLGEVRIMQAGSISRMERPETSLGARVGTVTGYGKGLRVHYHKGHLFYGHTGRYGGFLSDFAYSREAGLGYAILLNSAAGGKAIKAIKQILLTDLSERQSAIKTSNVTPADFSGTYRPVTGFPQLGKLSDFIIRLVDLQVISMDEDQVTMGGMIGDSQALQYFGDSLYAPQGIPAPTTAFVKDGDGTLLLLTEETAYRKVPAWQAYGVFYAAAGSLLIMVIALLLWLVRIPYLFFRRRNPGTEWLPPLAILSLAGMAASFLTLYNPMELYSPGAVLFFLFGYAFLVLSVAGLLAGARQVAKGAGGGVLLTSLACCFWAGYLWYYDIIGLMLWSY